MELTKERKIRLIKRDLQGAQKSITEMKKTLKMPIRDEDILFDLEVDLDLLEKFVKSIRTWKNSEATNE